ncbi:tigger transposable element-derived protein 1-like [Acyrthosiphon pisum]|uniref:DDE-1 domain-containing protein n=1 Tax=Acyrthosiphon pisum TaxID=7029 RepID=A0A8R2JKZ2_ACYPI|nr:tigger transposable element-derived protein 1-like [Acyrthosiphon pisum]
MYKEYPVNGGRFRKTFSDEQLLKLKEYITDIDRRSFGLTKVQCQKLVYEYASDNNVPHCFNTEYKMAGHDWIESFMKEFDFSLRKPEVTSIGRLMAFNKVNVSLFFDKLKEIRTRNNFSSSQIFNVDESGVSTVPCKLPKVLSPIGSRRVSKLVSAERGKNITVVCGVSAAGVYVPPFIIFPRIRMKEELSRGTPPGTLCVCNESGWMTTETFLLYLQHFSKHVRPNAESSILLLLDNHASHVSLKAIEFCRSKYITMLGFPPHTTHRLQPLDVAVFGALKTYYSQACDAWMVNNPGSH